MITVYIVEDLEVRYIWGLAKTPEELKAVLEKTGIVVPDDIQDVIDTVEEDGRWDDKYTDVIVRKHNIGKCLFYGTIA